MEGGEAELGVGVMGGASLHQRHATTSASSAVEQRNGGDGRILSVRGSVVA